MWFGRVATHECQEGSVLAHSTHVAGARIPKGTPLTAAHLRQLRDAGVQELNVAVLGPSDVNEDTAADQLARGLAGRGVALSRALTGRCNLHATQRGLVVLDEARLRHLNRTDWRLTVATVAQHRLVEAGEAVATVKVIPFAVDAPTLRQAATLASEPGALLRVAPLKPHSAALVLSGGSAGSDRLRKRTIAAQRARLGALGSSIDLVEICEHSTQSIAEALERCAEAGHSPILFIGASAVVDSADVFPAAVERMGGEVLHIGMPVDPGNLLVVARYGASSLFGVPGCARTLRPSGFDTVLRAQLAGVPLGPAQIMDLGIGGLLESAAGPASRPPPPDETRGVGAIVLAAGEGRRMPGAPKVLRTLQPGGPPLVRRVVDRLQAAQVSPIVVVTGHAAADVRAALSGTPARVAHNPDYHSGMGSSLATGAMEIDDVDSALVVLADMPDLEPEVVRALITAWRAGPHGIVAPVHDDRRGHPVLFDATHLGRLRACSGDVGARALLEEHPVHLVEVDSPGVLLDLDTSADLHARRRTEGLHG